MPLRYAYFDIFYRFHFLMMSPCLFFLISPLFHTFYFDTLLLSPSLDYAAFR